MTAARAPRRLVGTRRGRLFLFAPREVRLFALRDGLVHALLVAGEDYVVDASLGALEAALGRRGFVRVHRHLLVNLDQVVELARAAGSRFELRLAGDLVVTASRPGSARLRRLLGLRQGPRPAREGAALPAIAASPPEASR